MKKQKSGKETKAQHTYAAKIKVVGIGGGGGNAVSRMVSDIGVKGLEFIAVNTDAQDLDYCQARRKIYIGKNLTKGLGTGMNPELGKQAAEENRAELTEVLKGADLVFLTAGLGGGTGSGAMPLIAEVARETGALVVAVVTKPFSFEGSARTRIAQEALVKIKEKVDTLIVIPNDRIFTVIKKETPLIKAFEYIDGVLRSAVQGIAELIAMPGIINVDFADVKTVMKDAGPALVGTAVGTGADRGIHAINQIINSPLVEIGVEGAKGVLFGIAGNRDLKMNEINEIAKVVAGSVDPGAKIIFGAYHDRRLKLGQIKVTLIATGFNGQMMRTVEPPTASLFSEELRYARELGAEKEQAFMREPEEKKRGVEKGSSKKEEGGSILDIPAFLRKKK